MIFNEHNVEILIK